MSPKKNTAENISGPEKESLEIPNPSPIADQSFPKEEPREHSQSSEHIDLSAPETADNVKSDSKSDAAPLVIPVPPNEERTWAMLAHLSILLNLVTGFLGGIIAIIIYFIYKDRSRFIAYHAMQSFIFQSITWLGAGLLGGLFISIGSVLGFLIIPLLCLIPGFLILLLTPMSLIYGIVGAVNVNNGEDFRYWQVGDWVRSILDANPADEK
jgi:uncharacterized protein